VLQRVAVCCSVSRCVLQCVVVHVVGGVSPACCSVLQCVVMCSSVRCNVCCRRYHICDAACCNVSQRAAMCVSVCGSVSCRKYFICVLQHVAWCRSLLRCIFSVLQCMLREVIRLPCSAWQCSAVCSSGLLCVFQCALQKCVPQDAFAAVCVAGGISPVRYSVLQMCCSVSQ